MSQKRVFSIFRMFNEHEMYTLLTIINKQNYLIFIILDIFCIFIQLSKLDIEYFINSSPSLYLSLTNSENQYRYVYIKILKCMLFNWMTFLFFSFHCIQKSSLARLIVMIWWHCLNMLKSEKKICVKWKVIIKILPSCYHAALFSACYFQNSK